MHRYTLEPYHGPASRYTCPECNHKQTFSRYIDTQTNNHVADHVGRCSREDKCGYHFKPKEWLGGKSIVDSQWTMGENGRRSIVDSPWTMGENGRRSIVDSPWTMAKKGERSIVDSPWTMGENGRRSIVDSPWTMAKKGERSIVDSPWTMAKKGERSIVDSPWTMAKKGERSIVDSPWTMAKKGERSIVDSPWTMGENGRRSIVDSPWTMAKKGERSIVDSPWTMVEKENRKYPLTPNYGPSTMDYGLFQKSLSNYHQNNFTNWLIRLFGEDVTGSLISKYLIGTSKHWQGSAVFWQVDAQGGIRTGKIMLYGADGKRVKEPYNHINWVHVIMRNAKGSVRNENNDTSAIGIPTSDFSLKQCLFGEHLLKEAPLAPVAIVESEKSAIIASVYWPQFIWLAAGSLSNLNAEKCGVLKGRNVTLFPDLNCFGKWEQKARELKLNFKTSALLETAANNHEREQGQDVADYLLKFDYQEFGKKAESEKQEAKDCQLPTEDCQLSKDCQLPTDDCLLSNDCPLPTDNCLLSKDCPLIDELEAYFNSIELPEGPIRINKCSVISDVRLFIDSHLVVVKRYQLKDWFRVYLDRLKWLKGYLESAVGSHGKALEA
jgi:hypothetical protein